MIYKRAIGGLGDFLQMTESAIEAKEIIVISHSESGAKYYEAFGVNVIGEINFQSIPELQVAYRIGEDLERKYHSTVPIKIAIDLCKRPINIGPYVTIHPFGSTFSKVIDSAYNNKGKDFPLPFLDALIEKIKILWPKYPIRILGTEEQMNGYKCIMTSDIIWEPTTIWEAIVLSSNATYFIGADSFCKTARLVTGYNSHGITLVENKVDIFRDTHFIKPYEFMHNFFYFKDLNDTKEIQRFMTYFGNTI